LAANSGRGEDRRRRERRDGHRATGVSCRLKINAGVVPYLRSVSRIVCHGWRLMDAYKKWNVEAWSTADLELGEDDLRPLTIKKEDGLPPERQPGTAGARREGTGGDAEAGGRLLADE